MSGLIKLLYVEDDPDIRSVAELALEDEGFELIMCCSGEEALQVAEGLTPDLLLLDVMMPGLDGPETLKKLRDFPHIKDTPVIFMTAKIQLSEVQEYKAMGALDVIAKPFDVMTLADQIHKILETAHG